MARIYALMFFSYISVLLGDSFAQQAVASSGGASKTGKGQVSYSVGQVFFHTKQSAKGSVAEGVLSSVAISDIPAESALFAEMKNTMRLVYLSSGELRLSLAPGQEARALRLRLLDAGGAIVLEQTMVEKEWRISILDLPSAVYYLSIVEKEKQIQTFQITKH